LEGSIQSYVDHKTQNLRRELADAIEETRMELRTAGVSLNTQAQDFEGQITSIREDITCNERKFQAQLEEIKTAADRGSRPPVCASAVQPPTFDGTTSWYVFRRQFETIVEHTHWSSQEKSMYLITALKGRAADVIYGIPKNATYEETL
jgi:hypothetical protein